jgi:hypothetical protein
MQQPAAFFVCGQCDAGYDSASALNAHKSRSHRGSCSDQRLHPHNGASGEISKSQSRQRTSPADDTDASDLFRWGLYSSVIARAKAERKTTSGKFGCFTWATWTTQ